jgi:hypothetical protein
VLVLSAMPFLHPAAVEPAEWGTLVPGETTMAAVRARFGEPSSVARKKLDRYESAEWLYEGDRAPAGMIRMHVHFGILRAGKYLPNIVRTFGLEPKPGVFTRAQVTLAWGKPQKGGTQDGVPMLIHDEGLVVYYDKDIVNAVSMWFTVPRPEPSGAEAPKPAAAEGGTPRGDPQRVPAPR